MAVFCNGSDNNMKIDHNDVRRRRFLYSSAELMEINAAKGKKLKRKKNFNEDD